MIRSRLSCAFVFEDFDLVAACLRLLHRGQGSLRIQPAVLADCPVKPAIVLGRASSHHNCLGDCCGRIRAVECGATVCCRWKEPQVARGSGFHLRSRDGGWIFIPASELFAPGDRDQRGRLVFFGDRGAGCFSSIP